MKDYTHFYREALPISAPWAESWTLFLSAYNHSERVTTVFNKVNALEKYWLVHKEYDYSATQYPSGAIFVSQSGNEADLFLNLWKKSWETSISPRINFASILRGSCVPT
jgi:hypothetical protein